MADGREGTALVGTKTGASSAFCGRVKRNRNPKNETETQNGGGRIAATEKRLALITYAGENNSLFLLIFLILLLLIDR